MVYMRVRITASGKELIVNPNCPMKLLYKFIQTEMVAANSKAYDSTVALEEVGSLAGFAKTEGSVTKQRSSSAASRSMSKSLSLIARRDMRPDQEYDLCDEKANLKQIYTFDPWVNGWETEVFIDHATYFVVTFDRDEKGAMINIQSMLPKSHKHYSEMQAKIRRQSRSFSIALIEEDS